MYRIGELERVTRELRQDVRELRGALELAGRRIRILEGQTPQARQLQLEADLAAADLAESGYDRHGRDCQCWYCATDEGWPLERGAAAPGTRPLAGLIADAATQECAYCNAPACRSCVTGPDGYHLARFLGVMRSPADANLVSEAATEPVMSGLVRAASPEVTP